MAELADFLLFLFTDKKLSVSAIKGYRSTIAHTWRSSGRPDISADPVITKLIAGFTIERPRPRVSAPPWNLSVVLQYLMTSTFEPLQEASLRSLTFKTVFLLAFATAARRSELHALSAEDGYIAFSNDGKRLTLRLAPQFLAKNQAPNEVRAPYNIRALSHRVQGDLPDASLCPVRAVRTYIHRTTPLRRGRKRLFLSIQKNSEKEISRDSISRWIVTLISEAISHAGSHSTLRRIAGVSAHQVRAMATSWAAYSGFDLSTVKRSAFWKGHSTFSSFYLRDLSAQVGEISALCPLVAAQSLCQGELFVDGEEPHF